MNQTNAAYRARKRAGDVRPLGSIDQCDRCGADFIVNAGLQRFCPPCSAIHAAEYDRATALTFYHENKEAINPPRMVKRRIKTKACTECGTVFPLYRSRTQYCSEACRRIAVNRRWRERDRAKRAENKKPSPNP